MTIAGPGQDAQSGDLAALVRAIPDHPRPGILFRDISTLLLDGHAFGKVVDRMAERLAEARPQLVAGIEARGFLVAGAIAYRLGCGTLLLRKKGKLPGRAIGIDYALEYGTDRLEMHADACGAGVRVVLVDDLVATGGTALAGIALLRQAEAEVVRAGFVIDLPDLGGADRIRAAGVPVDALLAFPGH